MVEGTNEKVSSMRHTTNSPVYALTGNESDNEAIIKSIHLSQFTVMRIHGDNAKAIDVEESINFGERDGKKLAQKTFTYNVSYE